MHRTRVLVLTLHATEHRHGLWCDEHALPHRRGVTFYLLSSDGVSGPHHHARCDDD